MASEASPPSGRRARRILLWMLAAFAILLLMSLAAIGWLAGTGSGTRTLLSMAESISAGKLQFRGPRGSLTGPLHLDGLTLAQANGRTVLANVDLDWQPSALLQSTLHVRSLRIGHLLTEGSGDDRNTPPALPNRIGLPLNVQIDALRVDRGEVRRDAKPAAQFGPLALGLDFDGRRYRLDLAQFTVRPMVGEAAPVVSLDGTMTLSATRPYPLQGSFRSRGNAMFGGRMLDGRGDIRMSGSLEQLQAAIDLAIGQARLVGNARLQPFSDRPLGAAELSAQALDLSQFGPQLPQTALDATLKASDQGAGTLTVRNNIAGLNDRSKLPISALELDFTQTARLLRFERIHAALGTRDAPAGELLGNGQFADGILTLALHTDELDLKRVDSRLRRTRLAGKFDLRDAAGKREFTLAASEPLAGQRLMVDAHGLLDQAGLMLDRAELQAGSGRASATAAIGFDQQKPFRATGEISRFRLRDLGDFPQWPELQLTGSFSLKGNREPKLEADLSFDIHDSTIAGQPLRGTGRTSLRADRLQVPQLTLVAGANRVEAKGELAQSDSRLTFDLDMPRLDQIGPQFAGAVHAGGIVSGTLERPRLQTDWHARNARLPGPLQLASAQGKLDIALDRSRTLPISRVSAEMTGSRLAGGGTRVASLSARLQFSPQPDAPLTLFVQAQDLATGDFHARRFDANASGTTSRHRLDASLAEADQDWRIQADGGLAQLQQDPRWQGRIEQFVADGRLKAHLTGAASLLVSARQLKLDDFSLDAESGRIEVQRFTRDADGIDTRGRIMRLRPGQLLTYFNPAPPLRTDLVLSGEWDLRMADTLTGKLKLQRDSGDLTVLGSAPVTLGLATLSLDAAADASQATLQVNIAGSRLGHIMLDGSTRIGDGTNRFALAPDAPLKGNALIDVPSLRWIAPLISPTLLAEGKLQSRVTLGGSVGAPQLSGRIDGDDLRLSMADLGVDLRRGTLRSEFQGDRLLLQGLGFESTRSGQGKLTVSGPISLRSGATAADLTLLADRFTLLDRVDRRLTLSGSSDISYREQQAAVRGAFTVDSGAFDIGQADAPRLSDDVVVVGREEKKGPRALGLALDVTVDLGDGVAVTGRGVNATLVGKVRLASKMGEPPQAFGELRIAKGTFSAYGRELNIEQGVLRFAGPLNNPSLDILAMRRNTKPDQSQLNQQQVDAGVSIRGNVLAPRITLVSEPSVPDAEKLSWLVLGRSLASAGPSDASSLQSAAGSMLSAGAAAAVQSRIASALGLDTLSVGTSDDTLQQRIVTLGKQVSSRLYLSYQQALQGAGSVVLLRYALSPRLSVETEAGSRSAISLFYNIVFD